MKKTILAFTLILSIGILPAISQDKTEKKFNRKVEILNNGDKVQLKIIENGETVVDKSYNSMEDLKTDSELEKYNILIGSGSKVMIFKKSDGTIHEFDEDESNVWVFDENSVDHDFDIDNDIDIHFSSEDGHINITKGVDGSIIFEQDGKVVDIDAMHKSVNVKIIKKEDGSFIIEDKNGSRTIPAEELKTGKAMFFKQGSFEMDGDKSIMFNSKDADGVFSIELLNEGSWVMDSLHEKDHNMMFFSSDDVNVEFDGQKHVFIKSEGLTSENGQIIKIIVERIHLNISDVEDLKVVEEIPGSNVTSSKLLKLEEVKYYPNPNTGIFNLKFSAKEKPTQIRIIDMMGKEVYNENLKEFSGMYDSRIDLTGNDKGVYILQVLQGARSWNKKLVIE